MDLDNLAYIIINAFGDNDNDPGKHSTNYSKGCQMV